MAVSGLIQGTLERLGSPIMEQLWLLWGLSKDIKELTDTLYIIMGVLSDAEEKQQKNMAVKIWLTHLKEAAYDAADILDEFETEALRREVETEGRFTEQVRGFFSASNPVVSNLLMAHKVKDIREKLSKIAEKGNHLGLRVGEMSSEVTSRDDTDSHQSESIVKGREEDKEKIVELLLNMGNEEKVWIISIVGMGGLGKTTLAQLVYKDTRVKDMFHDRIWVCVSDNYDMPRLTKKIIESATGIKCDDDNMELLQTRLRKTLSGKKFFLVLDDVWIKKHFKWERLASYLEAGEMGSKILVTTRSEEDATIVGTHRLYPLSGLSEDDCWYLFHQQAFGQGQEEDPKLVDLGKEIVKRCGGLPLAVKAVGGLMRCKRGESEWISVRDSEIWNDFPEKHDSIFPALRLSYNDLPPHLKPCFAYCSIFPKDHPIQVERLIQLWMASGFIQPSQGNRLMEDIGKGYFKSLLQRSFFQDAEKDDDGNVVSCKMHDLMHDLARSVSEEARSTVTEDGKITIPDGCRHLFVEIRDRAHEIWDWEHFSITLIPSDRAKKLRTLLLLESRNCTLSHKFVTHLPCLRVLDLGTAFIEPIEDALNSISRLKQLRYLRMRIFRVQILPNSLSKLHNLQTMILMNVPILNELPREMRKMVSLRHLQIPKWDGSLTHMPEKMGELRSLQTLPVFVVGEDDGGSISQLGNLKYLSGELKIQNLENVANKVNAQEAKLSEKVNLTGLGLSWSRSITDAAGMLDGLQRHVAAEMLDGLQPHGATEMLDGLQPHGNLRCLRVENYGGERLPHWMGACGLPNLVELSLFNWRGWEQVQLPGQFRSLKSLIMSEMDAVKCFGGDMYGDSAFPSLEELILEDMANLEEWSVSNDGRETVVLPRLKRLVVSGCPKLSAVPYFPLLSSLSLHHFEAESLPNCFFQNQLTHLSRIYIGYCQNLESLSWELGNVAATLEELHIYECPKLSLFPEEMQHHTWCLRSLEIRGCNGLTSLRLQGLASLTSLSIRSCKNLASFVGGMHHLTALQRLEITECPELLGSSLADGTEHLTSLTSLTINRCAKVTHLPEGLKHATRLQTVFIINLPNLSALPDWIGNLSSLQDMLVKECPNVVSLPSAFQLLTNLRWLRIYECPELEKRCEKERGEDWHKISHIPDIDIHSAGSERQRHGRQLESNSCWISICIMWTAILNSFCSNLLVQPIRFTHDARFQALRDFYKTRYPTPKIS